MALRLKEILKEKKLSITDSSKMVGITQANMSLIVNGKSNPSLDTLERIAKSLEIPIQELFTTPGGDFYGLIVYDGVTYKVDSPEALKNLCDLVESKKDRKEGKMS